MARAKGTKSTAATKPVADKQSVMDPRIITVWEFHPDTTVFRRHSKQFIREMKFRGTDASIASYYGMDPKYVSVARIGTVNPDGTVGYNGQLSKLRNCRIIILS